VPTVFDRGHMVRRSYLSTKLSSRGRTRRA
jgi:hypothetical protein